MSSSEENDDMSSNGNDNNNNATSIPAPSLAELESHLRCSYNNNATSIPAPSLAELESHLRCSYHLAVRDAAQKHNASMAALSSQPSRRTDGIPFSSPPQNNNPQTDTPSSKTSQRNKKNTNPLPSFQRTNPDLARATLGVDCTWVDGDIVQFQIPKDQMSSDGKSPYFGWEMWEIWQVKLKACSAGNQKECQSVGQ